jgi:uncharacterized protein
MFKRDILELLNNWKNKKNRKPLVLRGARQVGKTSAVSIFAGENFSEFVNINLEKSENYELFKKVKTLSDFEKTVNLALKKKITEGQTLIFIDEIQNAPNLIELLRFFYEERPNLHIIAAGSLLEAFIEKEGFSMPVGRVEYAYMHPLTFFEFLGAIGEDEFLGHLKVVSRKDKIAPGLHEYGLRLFKEYALIGGMPEAVELHRSGESWENLNSFYSSLLTAYAEDIFKYAGRADVDYVRHVLERSPLFAGERITYEKFGDSGFRSREMSKAFRLLEKAMLLTQVQATESISAPLLAKTKRAKKLIFLDAGLVNYKNNIQAEFLKTSDLSDIYRGRLAEQIVGQNLLAGLSPDRPIHYWARERPTGSAEVDFCFFDRGKILGIEVKSGHSARLKSLFSLADSAKNVRLVRIYGGELKMEKIRYNEKSYSVLSLPFYLSNRVREIV